MNSEKAALYAKNSRAQFFWNTAFLSEIAWNRSHNTKVVDIGCGTGESTKNLLATRDEVESVLAFDISSNMIDYANEHNSHEKIVYKVGNIEDIDLVTKLEGQAAVCKRGSFDRVVSLNVLHWVKDQTVALKNIVSFLRPGGDCLLVFGSKPSPAFLHAKTEILKSEAWKDMIHDDVNWRHGRNSKWLKYSEWRLPDPADGYRRLCEKERLVVTKSEVREVKYTFVSVEECKGVLQYLLPHVQQIPKELVPKFMDDVYDLFQSVCMKDTNGQCMWHAHFLFVTATLP
ncbi:juvenile hormone acid O-methyltransferase-like [Corticium candelabrum]|uniref:juvenile hormone acid O-methyltransferase-like n=1 Tax=Corticium candelabrum TaxID=121492 RepID=UPI002E2577B4|nr:juvenile hormone acid O-methyltransferase-like [Corticium candelabrum]